MKNFTFVLVFLLLVFSFSLNIVLLKEVNKLRRELNTITMPVNSDTLQKLMEEIKNLSNTDINYGNDT